MTNERQETINGLMGIIDEMLQRNNLALCTKIDQGQAKMMIYDRENDDFYELEKKEDLRRGPIN